MNTRNLTQTFVIAIATIFTLAIGSAAFGQDYQNSGQLPRCNQHPNAIVGSWLVQLGNGTNRILETFNSDGTVVEAGQGDIVAPFNPDFPSFTAGHGAWKCDADGNWVVTTVILMFDVSDPFNYLGQFKSHQKFALSDANNLSGSDKLIITTPDGTVIDGGSTGMSTGTRIQAEDF